MISDAKLPSRILYDLDLRERELLRLSRRITPEPNTGCWIWEASLDPASYGMAVFAGRPTKAHIAVWLASGREIATGLELDHRCRNRWCVNPSHIEAVTHKENWRRSVVATGRSLSCRRWHGDDCRCAAKSARSVEVRP